MSEHHWRVPLERIAASYRYRGELSRQRNLARFWSRIEKSDGCWTWNGIRDTHGYGKSHVLGEHLAHRITYRLLVGPIPEGLTLDHLCRNTSCVNPAHLEPVTHRVNILRGEGRAAKQARQTHCIHGHPFDAENTFYNGRKRQCRACRNEWHRRRRAAA